MKKKLKCKLAGLMAGLMATSSLTGLFAIPVLAATDTDSDWEYETVDSYIRLTAYKGSDSDVVMPDIIDGKVVFDANHDLFDGHDEIESLTLGKYFEAGNEYIFDDLVNVKEYNVAEGNRKYSTDDGVLYREKSLISYPKAKTGSYQIKEDTTGIGKRAFFDTEIDTLTVPTGTKINNELNSDGNKFIYSFLGAQVDHYNLGEDTTGAIIIGGRLVAYGNSSNADLSNITSANPFAFQTVEVLESSNLPESVLKTIPFSFYSGEKNGLQTRYFNIDGKTAYCYNHGKLNPQTVGNLSDYDESVSTDVVRHNVKAALFAGYPNDAYDLIGLTGVDEEAAKNITGSLVWKAVDGKSFEIDEIYGIEDNEAANEYAEALIAKVEEVSEDEMSEFELKFYTAKNNKEQGLVVINKVSKPVIPIEKPSVTISKQDIVSKKELPGAHLSVTKDGVIIDEWVSTTEKHVIKDLEDGSYVLTETTAPNGYLIAESITFTVENGKVSTPNIIMYDAPEDTYVYISKQDLTTKKELPGAKLELYKDNNLVESWTSTTEVHKIKNLDDGTYVLKEITAPNGYYIAEDVTFEVKDGKTSPNPVVMYDEVKKATDSDAKPDKPIEGGSSGSSKPTPKPDTNITIIPTQPVINPVQPETAPQPTVERKPIKTGDVMGILQVILGLMVVGAPIVYTTSKRRK